MNVKSVSPPNYKPDTFSFKKADTFIVIEITVSYEESWRAPHLQPLDAQNRRSVYQTELDPFPSLVIYTA